MEAYCLFSGSIDTVNSGKLIDAFSQAVNSGVEHLHLGINSTGGGITEGIRVFNIPRALPITVSAYNIAEISSIASLIFAAAEGRYASRFSKFLLHPSTVSLNAPLELPDLRQIIDNLEVLERSITAALKEVIDERYAIERESRHIHLDATQAVEIGLANEIKEFYVPAGFQVIQI